MDKEAALIASLAQRILGLEKRRADLEERLRQTNAELREVQEQLLPDAMYAAGVASYTLTTGERVTVREDLRASIPRKNKEQAAEWLAEHGHAALVKSDLVLHLEKGEEDIYQDAQDALARLGLGGRCSREIALHTGQVKAALKELLSRGEAVPLELFGAYPMRWAVIKDSRKGDQ